jgi:hypothetical protein
MVMSSQVWREVICLHCTAGEVAQQVVEEGGVSVIKEAMAKFPENAELAKEGQEALENINKNRK